MQQKKPFAKYLLAVSVCICLLSIGVVSAHISGSGSQDVTTSWSPTLPQFFWWWPSAYITDTDNSTTVDIATGDWFVVQLPENPTNGYQWDMTASSGLDIFYTDYRQDDNPDNIVGIGGTHVWFIKTTGSGNQTVTGVYKHPWESGTPDDPRFIFTIHIV